jgi:hypothetical protein
VTSRHEFGHKPKGRKSHYADRDHTSHESYHGRNKTDKTDRLAIRVTLLAAEYGKHHKAA